MAQDEAKPTGPDLTQGMPLTQIPFSEIVGHVGEEQVLLVRTGTDVFAVGAHCTHYHGPLGEGLVVGETVRCPWHHACFDLRTGEAIAAPAFDALACWEVERRGETVFVQRKREGAKPKSERAQRNSSAADCHRRRWCCRLCGGRDAAPRRPFRRARHAEQRRCAHPLTGRICPRTISPARRLRIGCRWTGELLRRQSTSICA